MLWKFRRYSLLDQVLIWTVLALAFGALLERFLTRRRAVRSPVGQSELSGLSSTQSPQTEPRPSGAAR